MANPFEQFSADAPGIVAQPEVQPSGKNPFEQFRADEPAQPQVTQPPAPQPSLYQSVYENPMLGAEQRTVPYPDRYGKPISSDTYVSDAGEVSYRDAQGNVVPTDMSKHVVLVGPNGRKTVYQRSPDTEESPIVGGSRMLSLGLGPGAPTTAAAVARTAPAAEASIPELKAAAISVFRNPEILARQVHPGEVASAFQEIAPDLQRFDPQITARLSNELSGLGSSPQGIAINDLNIASERLGVIANETQMTPGGLKGTPASAAATIVKKKIDGLIRGAAPEWEAADKNYSAAEAAQTIVNREEKATVLARGKDIAGRMATQATQLLANPRNLRGFTPDEVNQLREISQGSVVGDRVRTVNDWLLRKLAALGPAAGAFIGYQHSGPLGGLAGMVGTAAVEATVGAGLTKLGNYLSANQVNMLSQAIRTRSPLGQQLAQNAQDWEAARQAMHATPTSMTLTALAQSSRELSKALRSAGVEIGPAQLMRGAKPDENQ